MTKSEIESIFGHENKWLISPVRKRFAWFPVKLYKLEDGFITPTGKRIWLKHVVEMETLWEGWIAYERYQNIGKERND